MNSSSYFNVGRIRLIIFALVSIIHVLLILFVAFKMEITVKEAEPVAGVMKLVDVQEEIPPERPPDMPLTNTMETIAQTMIATDEPPPPPMLQGYGTAPERIEYLPQHRISVVPVLPDDQIRRNTVYPPIAQRSGIEGRVILELFIDRYGNIRDIRILQENPEGRGFGEAALNSLKGIRAISPAEANGVPVAVRYRIPISFRLN